MPTEQIPSVNQNIWSQASAFLKIAEPRANKIPIQAPALVRTTENPVKQLVQPAIRPQLTLESVSSALKTINESVVLSRQADKANGIGLLTGASGFGSAVSDAYNFLLAVGPYLSGKDADKQLLGIATDYTMAKGHEFMQAPEAAIAKLPSTSSQPVTTTSLLKPIDEFLGETGSRVAGALGAAYSIYELAQGQTNPISGAVQGITTGAYIGSYFGPIGTSIGAIVGGVGGMLSALFKSGKPAEQKERDSIRKQLQAAGILDGEWNIQLANGAKFDFGKDGGAKLQNLDGTERRFKEFDLSNPLTEPVAQLLAPLAQTVAAGHPRLTQEFTAYLTNAAISNAASIQDSIINVKALYVQFGVPFEEVLQKRAA